VTELEYGVLKGVGGSTINRLLKAGFTTVESVAATPARELAEKAGLGAETAEKVALLALMHVDPGFVPAMEVLQRRRRMMRCTTGSKELDLILAGGVETGSITEFIGEYGSGKTQICLTLSVMAQLPPEQGGLGGGVAVIDAEGTFLPERIVQIAAARGLDPKEVLSNIFIAKCYNSDHLSILIDNLPGIIEKNNVKLVIVDSIISHFRGEYLGRENLSERQQKLGNCLHRLMRIAETFNVAVVVTNQVQASPTTIYGDPNRPTGGNVLAHACTHRVYLRKGRKNTRIAKIIDSPSLPEREARFIITEKGVEDVEEARE